MKIKSLSSSFDLYFPLSLALLLLSQGVYSNTPTPESKTPSTAPSPAKTDSKNTPLTKPDSEDEFSNIYKPVSLKLISEKDPLYAKFYRYFSSQWKKSRLGKRGAQFKGPLQLNQLNQSCGKDPLLIFDFHELQIAHPDYQKVGQVPFYSKGQGITKPLPNHLLALYRYEPKGNKFHELYYGPILRIIGSKRILGTPLTYCPQIFYEIQSPTGNTQSEWLEFTGISFRKKEASSP